MQHISKTANGVADELAKIARAIGSLCGLSELPSHVHRLLEDDVLSFLQ